MRVLFATCALFLCLASDVEAFQDPDTYTISTSRKCGKR
jgi:hypothetical protein